MKKIILCLLTAFLLAMTGCGSEVKKSDRISIVTTCFPPYDFARAVTGDNADITMLLCPGAEAHSYEPAPLDILKIQQCDVFIYIGGEGEVWADKILSSLDTSDMTVIRLFDFVEPLCEEEVMGASPIGHEHEHSHEHEHEHEHEEDEEFDEHIWTSPSNAIKCVNAVEENLSLRYPEQKAAFSANADAYVSKLGELDKEFSEMVQNAPSDNIIIADRFPFRYLAADYGLNYYAAFSGCSSESEPGVYTMAFLIDKILEEHKDTIFYLEFSTQKLSEKLCDATGAKALPLQSCHNVTPRDFDSGVTYIDLMTRNLENLREALY